MRVFIPPYSSPIWEDTGFAFPNGEGVINSVTEPISAAGCNIENMESKSKKDYAYTCLDVKGNPAGIEDKLKAVPNVVGVRVVK